MMRSLSDISCSPKHPTPENTHLQILRDSETASYGWLSHFIHGPVSAMQMSRPILGTGSPLPPSAPPFVPPSVLDGELLQLPLWAAKGYTLGKYYI